MPIEPRKGKSIRTSSKRLFTIGSFSVLAFATAFAAAHGADERMRVRVVAPERRVFVERIPVQGTVRAKTSAAIAARVAGTIDALLVKEGATVVVGTPLFRIDRENLENALRSAENDVRLAEAALEQSKASVKKTRTDEERMTRLVKTGAVSETDTDKAVLAARTTEAQLAGAKALLAKTKAGLDVARKNLADSEVCAPFAGTVVRKLKDTGDFASPGMPVFSMEDVEHLEIRYSMDAARYREVFVGKTKIDGRPVSWKSPTVDPATRTFEVRVDVSGADGFCPGMIVDSEVVLSSAESLAVPASAINPDKDGRYRLFIVEEGKVVSCAVETPKMSGGWCSIGKGTVPPGAKVVAEGMLLVHDGDEVIAVEEEK